jgi:hypothetical protein
MIRSIKIIVKKNEIKQKKNDECIATIQMENRVPLKRKKTFRLKRRNK